MAGRGKDPTWEGGGSVLKVTVPNSPDLVGEIAELGALRRKAEGRAELIEQSEQVCLMLRVAAEVMSRCPSCVAGLPCQTHNLEALGLRRGSAKKQKPIATNPTGEHAAVVDLFDRRFAAATGERPAWLLPRAHGAPVPAEFKMIANKLKAFGFDRIARAIDGAFANGGRGVTIRAILADPDKYLRVGSFDRRPSGQTR